MMDAMYGNAAGGDPSGRVLQNLGKALVQSSDGVGWGICRRRHTRAEALGRERLARGHIDQLGKDLDLGDGLAARDVDLEGTQIGDEGVLAIGRADCPHRARVLEGLDDARLHETRQPVAPGDALVVGDLVGARAHHETVGLEGMDGGRLVHHELPGGRLVRGGEGARGDEVVGRGRPRAGKRAAG